MLKTFCDKRVKIIDSNGKTHSGIVLDYIYPDENVSEKESIIVETLSGRLIEFYEKDIRSISVL